MNYEKGEINLKGINISWVLLDEDAVFPNSKSKEYVEEFKFTLSIGNNKETFKFYNSIYERDLSIVLKNSDFMSKSANIKAYLHRSLWGGYSESKDLKDLDNKRVYDLVYSFLNNIFSDYSYKNLSFKDFCSGLGYSDDSLKARNIYSAVNENNDKLENILYEVNEKDKKFFLEDIPQESEEFANELKKVLKVV